MMRLPYLMFLCTIAVLVLAIACGPTASPQSDGGENVEATPTALNCSDWGEMGFGEDGL